MDLDERVFRLIKASNKDWVNKVTQRDVDKGDSASPLRKNQRSGIISAKPSTDESESCLQNNLVLSEKTDNEAAVWQDKLLEQQKQINELQRKMQLVDSQCGLIFDTDVNTTEGKIDGEHPGGVPV